MAQFQISTPDEPSMFAAAQGLGLIDATTAYAPGIVGSLTGGTIGPYVAWSANMYGVQQVPTGAFTTNAQGQQVPVMQTNPGFYGILLLPNEYCLPGDPTPLAQRVYSVNPTTGVVTVTPFVWGPVTITGVPASSPMVFS